MAETTSILGVCVYCEKNVNKRKTFRHGADVNARATEEETTPLHDAVLSANVEVSFESKTSCSVGETLDLPWRE